MKKTEPDTQRRTCPSCGAPIVSEICAYCGAATGLNTAEADMEYPVLECREVTLNFWTIWFPMIFAVAFGIPGLTVLSISLFGYGGVTMVFVGIPFLLVGAGAAFFVLRTLSRYRKVKRHGKRIQGTVYGYMDDNVLLNDRPAQVVKLLVQTSDGPRFILYQLATTAKPYGVQDKIDLMVYENCFMICKDREVARW